jgi:hypothetical protein
VHAPTKSGECTPWRASAILPLAGDAESGQSFGTARADAISATRFEASLMS